MFRWLIESLKQALCKRELAALERYRIACEEAQRWLDGQSRLTADWIRACGRDDKRVNIAKHRMCLKRGTSGVGYYE